MRATLLTGAAIGTLAAGAASAQTAPRRRPPRRWSPAPLPTGPRAGPARPRSTPGSRRSTARRRVPTASRWWTSTPSTCSPPSTWPSWARRTFQKDNFGIILDAVYAKLGTDGTWVQNRVKTETDTKLGFYTAALSYRVDDDPKGFVDVYGGARYFDTTVEFKHRHRQSRRGLLQEEPDLDRRRSSASAAA